MFFDFFKIYFLQKKNAWRGNREKLLTMVTLALVFFLLPLFLVIAFLEESFPSILTKGLIKSADIINGYVLLTAMLIAAKNLIFGMDFEFESKFKNIAVLPVKRFTLFIIEIIISLANILNLFLILFFIYLLHFLPNINSLNAIILFIMYLVSLYLILYFFVGIFSLTISKLSSGLNFSMSYVIVFILSIIIVAQNDLTCESAQKIIIYFNGILSQLPFSSFFTDILGHLQLAGLIHGLFSYLIITLFIALLLYGLYRQYLVINFKAALHSDKDIEKNKKVLFIFNKILTKAKFSPPFSALLIKETIYLFRSARMRSFMLIAILTEYMYLKKIIHPGSYGFSTILLLILAPTVMAAEALFVWEYDGKGGSVYFEIPVKFRAIIMAKNISFLFYILLIQIGTFFVVFYFMPQLMTFINIILSLIFTILFYTINVHLTNYLIIEHPNKVSFNSLFSRSGKTIVNIYNMISLFAYYFLILLLILLPPIIIFIVLPFLTAASIFIYYRSLDFYADRFVESRDYLIKELS